MVEYNGLNLFDFLKIIVFYFFCSFVGLRFYYILAARVKCSFVKKLKNNLVIIIINKEESWHDVAAISLAKAFLSTGILLDLFHNIKMWIRRREYLQH